MSTIKQEHEALEKVINAIIEAGFTLHGVDNGDGTVRVKNVKQAMEEATATDESNVFFTREINGERTLWWIFVVFGNSPCEVVADYSLGKVRGSAEETAFDEAITNVTESYV